MREKRRKNRKRAKKIKIFLLVLLLVVIGVVAYIMLSGKKDEIVPKIIKKAPEKKVKIVDLDSNSRPYAVMINNHPTARKYHSGLQDAYIVYEIIVEGGFTRMMAVYKDADVDKIGSVRSSRHYFLDYAMENDAVYVHWGWSPMAEADIGRFDIQNINGLTYEGKYFYRDKNLNVSLEHKGFTNSKMIKEAIDSLNYRKTSDKDLLLNYVIDDVDMSKLPESKIANNVDIVYSSNVKTSYVYDESKKVYLREVNGEAHTDYVTKKQYTVKNIITYQVDNYMLAGDSKGRLDIDNLGSGTGYYISDGYAVPIKWEKSSRTAQTKYTYNDGTVIDVNDGNTFIQIQPSGKTLNIS